MRCIMKKTIGLLISLFVLLGTVVIPATVIAGPYYEVTVTNLTRGQIFTPVMVATHMPGVTLFNLGEAASDELAQLAEGGNTAPLEEKLMAMPAVGDVVNSGGLLKPGETTTIMVQTGKRFTSVSLAAMLVPTNDGFVALNGVRGPLLGFNLLHYTSPVYDAGSEMNTESCEDIPGGGDCAGNGYTEDDGEGYVHIHAGIHGIGDLDRAVYDWRNPAAAITIRRVSKVN